MQFKSLAFFTAFATLVVAVENSAHLYLPDGALGTCKTSITDDSLAVALSPTNFNLDLCGQSITVSVVGGNTSVVVPILDQCTDCDGNQIELTQGAFNILLPGSPDDAVEVSYDLP